MVFHHAEGYLAEAYYGGLGIRWSRLLTESVEIFKW